MKIFYTKLDLKHLQKQLDEAPKLQLDFPQLKSYANFQSKAQHLVGRLLLRQLLTQFYQLTNSLKHLQYTKYGKPYLSQGPHFSIAHTQEYVICAISDHSSVGIDIEKSQPIVPSDFKAEMAPQYNQIIQSQKPASEFLRYWTLKESVIKADGRGLQIDLASITFHNHQARIGNDSKVWHTQTIYPFPDYTISIASEQPFQSPTPYLVNLSHLFTAYEL